jgi:hypothetical protein
MGYEANKRWRKRHPEKVNKYRRDHPEKNNEYNKRNYRQTECNNWNRGKLWLPEEDSRITSPLKQTDRTLSGQLGRSVKAIQKRRYKLKKAIHE